MTQHTRIQRLLVANRGEIARRIFRTAHRLGMQTVAVYSDADRDAMHVREATMAVAIGGLSSAQSYLRIDALIAAARASEADAIHPGYGFLSENADFAQAVIDAGLTWVGPPPAAIRALGSKSSAKAIAQAQGVPCLPGYWGDDQSDARFAAEAERVGFPVMVKAAAGGGGRGMRLVMQASHLADAVTSARSEAQSAFGSGELLLELALLDPRHVEVQVFADSHGNCIHLGERDCSVQRRHQKLIEESPSPAVNAELRERMGRCAVDLAKAAGYVGAGTVEFLLQDEAFFLMEMNTRLQVEHPVTEARTGLDLVEWQLRVAQGEALPLSQEGVVFSGHAIEVRLCAEDEAFVPHSGVVLKFADGATGLRFDHAIETGTRVSPYYDSMLGKLIAHAATRVDAIAQLAGALDRLEVLGLPTNRQFLVACLRHATFDAGDATIAFIAEHGDEIRSTIEKRERAMALAAGLAAIYGEGSNDASLACLFTRPVVLRHRGATIDARIGDDAIEAGHASVVRLSSGAFHVQSQGIDLVIEDASFEPAGRGGSARTANELRAPFNGKVIAVKAVAGAVVARGDTLLVLESMKLEHALCASRDGVIQSILVEPGQQAATAQVLMTFEAAA